MNKRIWILLTVLLSGCGDKPATLGIGIKLAEQQKTVVITGINEGILQAIDHDSVSNWQSLATICKMPADTALKDYQPIQPGSYAVKNGQLWFTPDTPFVAGQRYFVRYYNYAGNKTLWDYLKRKTTKGQLHYTDLIFKL